MLVSTDTLWVLIGLAVLSVLIIILRLRKVRVPACPAELDVVEKSLAAIYDDVKIVRLGDYLSIRAKSDYIPLAVVIDCKKREVKTDWPWEVPVLLLFVPNLQLFAILLLLWMWDVARGFRKTVLYVINEASQ